MKVFNQLTEKIDNLSIRERGAIFVAVLAVIFFVWDSYLMADLKIKERDIKAQLQKKQAERMGLNLELQEMISKAQDDPNELNRKKLEMLRSEVARINVEVADATHNLVSPDRMAGILESVLAGTRGLDLVEVKGLGSSALLDTGGKDGKTGKTGKTGAVPAGGANTAGEPAVLDNAYKHGLRIVFDGSYMDTLRYVEKLEQMHSGFLWDSLELDVKEYPRAQAAITVYTLSLDDNWIGV